MKKIAGVLHAIALVGLLTLCEVGRAVNVTVVGPDGGNSSSFSSAISTEEQRNLQVYIFQDGAQCRCEASWENLYNRRGVRGQGQPGYFYNYQTTQVQSNNLVTIQGVYVLQNSAPECRGGPHLQRGPGPRGTSTSNNNQRGRGGWTQGGGRPRTSGVQYHYGNRRELLLLDAGEEGLELVNLEEDAGFDAASAASDMKDGSRSLIVDMEEIALLNDAMGEEEQQEETEEHEHRDLQRYHGPNGNTNAFRGRNRAQTTGRGAAPPRTYGGARNYGTRPYGGRTYGYGKGGSSV